MKGPSLGESSEGLSTSAFLTGGERPETNHIYMLGLLSPGRFLVVLSLEQNVTDLIN